MSVETEDLSRMLTVQLSLVRSALERTKYRTTVVESQLLGRVVRQVSDTETEVCTLKDLSGLNELYWKIRG